MEAVLVTVSIPNKAEELRLRKEESARRREIVIAKTKKTMELFQAMSLSTNHSTTYGSMASCMSTNLEPAAVAVETATADPFDNGFVCTAGWDSEKSETTPQQENCVVNQFKYQPIATTSSTTTTSSKSSINTASCASLANEPSAHDVQRLRNLFMLNDKSTTSKDSKAKKRKRCLDLDLPHETSMEEVLRTILNNFQIKNAYWLGDITGKRIRVQFNTECEATYKQIMMVLNDWDIGKRYGTFVACSQCCTSKQPKSNVAEKEEQTIMQRFMGAVKTRLLIMKMLQEMHDQAMLSFNFGLLLVSAGAIACFALAANSAIYIVSSMLLSPLLGPIVAGLYGIFIGNKHLALLGLKNCLIGILVSTCVGLATGFILAYADPRYERGEGLTNEMIMRTDLYSLLTGSIVASTCGAAIAIAMLNKNTSSLVGAAIAGSLLPPAVNAGFIWSLACIAKLYEHDSTYSIVKQLRFATTTCSELCILGSISMCLTFSNIIFIYLSGFVMLKIKEIMPANTMDTAKWQRRIALVRSYQRDANAKNILVEELDKLPNSDQRKLQRNSQRVDDIFQQRKRAEQLKNRSFCIRAAARSAARNAALVFKSSGTRNWSRQQARELEETAI